MDIFCFENTHLLQKSYLSLPQKNRSVRRKHFLLTLLFSFGPYCLTVPLHFASLWGVAVLVAAFCYALDGDLVVVLMRGSPCPGRWFFLGEGLFQKGTPNAASALSGFHRPGGAHGPAQVDLRGQHVGIPQIVAVLIADHPHQAGGHLLPNPAALMD